MFIRFFVEENHINTDWKNKNEYKKIYIEFLNNNVSILMRQN
jgi:hypothetical protein